jgi:hypothetical protein
MRLEALRREVRALRDGRRRAYEVEEPLRDRLDEALELRRHTTQRLLRRLDVIERLLSDATADDEAARRHLVGARYEDAVVALERVETTLARVRELGRALDAIAEARREVEAWSREVDFSGILAASATLRIPRRLVDEAERCAVAGRPRAAQRLVEMTHGEIARWSREPEAIAGPAAAGATAPPAEDATASALAGLRATHPRLAERLAEELISLHRPDEDRPARRQRLLADLAAARRRAEALRPAARHPDP